MTTTHDILRSKGHTVHSVRPDDSVLAALGVMAEHDIGAVLVLDGDEVVGILTERDYARKVALVGRASKDSPVRSIMTASCARSRSVSRACRKSRRNPRSRKPPAISAARCARTAT